jgi:hypothetical protein
MSALRQATLFDNQRMRLEEALELTAQSLRAYGERYRHWAIAFSGGKDSGATLTAVLHLIKLGLIALKTWPQGWKGTEPRADVPFDNVLPDGSIQPVMKALLV